MPCIYWDTRVRRRRFAGAIPRISRQLPSPGGSCRQSTAVGYTDLRYAQQSPIDVAASAEPSLTSSPRQTLSPTGACPWLRRAAASCIEPQSGALAVTRRTTGHRCARSTPTWVQELRTAPAVWASMHPCARNPPNIAKTRSPPYSKSHLEIDDGTSGDLACLERVDRVIDLFECVTPGDQ